MRAGIAITIVLAALVEAGTAQAACPSGHTRDCVNLDLVPQISQQIIAERAATPTKPVPAVEAKTPYTGPTVGVTSTVKKAPTVGYRWAIN